MPIDYGRGLSASKADSLLQARDAKLGGLLSKTSENAELYRQADEARSIYSPYTRPTEDVSILRKIVDADTVKLNDEALGTRLVDKNAYETPKKADWFNNPRNVERMSVQRQQLANELNVPLDSISNEDVFARGSQQKSEFAKSFDASPNYKGTLPSLVESMSTGDKDIYGRQLRTVQPLAGDYTTTSGRNVKAPSQVIPQTESEKQYNRNVQHASDQAALQYSLPELAVNVPKSIASGILNTAESVLTAPQKEYKLLGGDYLEKGSEFAKQHPTYASSMKTIMDTMNRAAKHIDTFDKENIGYDSRRADYLQKQVGKAFDEKNYVTGVLGALATNPAGAIEMAASMYGFSKAMSAAGATGVPVIAGSFMDNADQAREIFVKEHGREPDASETSIIAALAAAGTAMDTAAAKYMLGGAKGEKIATNLTKSVDELMGKIPNSVAKVALGITGKTAAMMGTEGLQEGFTEATTVLGGTQDLDKALQDKYKKQVYTAAGVGAISGPGMHTINVAENVGKEVLANGISPAFDQLRTMQPVMSPGEKRDVELAGGKPGLSAAGEYEMHPAQTAFSQALKSNDMETAKSTLDGWMQEVGDKVDAGELDTGSAEYIDTRTKMTNMHEAYQRKLMKEVPPEFKAAVRDYPRHKTQMEKDPDTLGSSRESLGRNLQDMMDYGVQLDDTDMQGVDELAKDLGIDISQYKAEQEALKPFRVSEIKATGKDVGTVAYESLIGENGVQRTYEKMKAAVQAGDQDTANQMLGKLQHFKDTQTSKVAKLQAGLDEYKANPTGKITVPYSVDDKYKFTIGVQGKIETAEHAINAANKVITESSKVVDTLDKVLQAVQVKESKQSKPKEAIKQAETQQEPTEESKPVKDTAEVQEEPTEAEVKAKAKEVRESVRTKPVVQERKASIKEALKRIGIKAKGEAWKAKDKAYIQDLGKVEGNTVELNDDVLESMSIAMINWIAQDAENTMKVTDKDIKRMLKIKGDKITSVQLKMMSGKGVFRKNVVQALGQAVMNELGLELPEDVLYNVKQSIVTGLGNTAVAYMRDQGMLSESEITAAEWNKANKLEGVNQIKQSVKMIQFTYDAIAEIKNAKQMLKADPELRYKDQQDKGPQYGKATSKKKHEFRNRTGEISEQDEARLSAQDKIQHNVKNNVYKAYKALGEYGKVAAGWVDVEKTKATTHTTTRQAIQAVNNSIERSLENLEEHIENADGKMYSFNYFMSGNGRDMIDSNTFNPQSDKIHRHMDYTGKVTYINTQEDSRELELFKIAVLQGLDIKTDDKRSVEKMTPDEISVAWDKLLADDEKLVYAEAMSEGEVEKALAKEIAEYAGSKGKMHTIDALVALGDYIYAEKTGNPLGTTLQLEVDAVTSGWILALMQSPVFDMQTNKDYLAKGGVYLDNMNANFQDRAKAKEMDSYETVAEAVAIEMADKIDESVQNILPVDRKFAKAPFMTNVTYGAGIDGVKADIVEQYIQNLYDKMAKSKEGLIEAAKALRALGIHLGAVSNRTEYLFDDKMYKAIEKAINETYGKAVENALSKKYKAFIDVRNTINKAFEEMFQPYAQKYAEGLQALKEKGNITAKELKDLEASLVQYIPTIKSPNGTDVQIYSKEKIENLFPDDYTFQTQFLNASDITTQAEIKRIVAAKAAGGVVPIHFIDGAIIGQLLQKFQMTGIYDAGMFNLGDVDASTKMYNEEIMKISKEYNLLEQIIKAGEGTVSADTMQDLKEASATANENRKQIHESDINVQHFAMAGIAYKQESKTKPMSEKKVEDTLKDTSNAVVNGVGRLDGTISTEDMNAIMSVIKQFKEC